MEDKIKQVIVIRKDLKMRRGKEIAHGAHASMAFLSRAVKSHHPIYNLTNVQKEWLVGSFTKICVVVNSEKELDSIFNKCKEGGLEVSLITDDGLTEFNGVKTKTCLAIGPDYSSKIDPITKDLKLY